MTTHKYEFFCLENGIFYEERECTKEEASKYASEMNLRYSRVHEANNDENDDDDE